MTAFPSEIPVTKTPRELVDEATNLARSSVTPAQANMRKVPRYSIEELNQSNIEDLKNQYLKTTYDDRHPVTKFLDLIDAPRNAILGALAPSIRRKAEAEGNTGTFGQGKVFFSDVLGELGVENRVARGVLGFVGDLAFDPLTYLGPGAIGARVALKGGGQLGIRKAGIAYLREGAEKLARGGADETIQGLAKGVGFTEGRLKVLREAADKERAVGILRKRLEGEVTTGKIGQAFSAVGMNENRYRGGAVPNLFQYQGTDEALSAGAKAARDFVTKFGEGTAGVGLTRDSTQQVAHLPFTDIGIRIPGINQTSRTALTNLKIARDTENGVSAVEALENITRAAEAKRGVAVPMGVAGRSQETWNEAMKVRDLTEGPTAKALDDEQAAMNARHAAEMSSPPPLETPESLNALHQSEQSAHTAQREAHAADIDAALARQREHFEQMEQTASAADLTGIANSPSGLLAMGNARAQAKVMAEHAQAEAERYSAVGKLVGSTDDREQRRLAQMLEDLQTTPEKAEALAKANSCAHDAALKLSSLYEAPLKAVMSDADHAFVNVAKRAMGTSDDVIGSSLMGSLRSALVDAGVSTESGPMRALGRLSQMQGRTFGVGGGVYDDVFRDYKGLYRAAAIENQIGGSIVHDLTKILDTHNVPPEARRGIGEMMTVLFARETGGEHGFWYDKWVPGWKPENSAWTKVAKGEAEPSALSARLLGSEASGLFDPKSYPGLYQEMNAMAQKWVKTIRDIGDTEVSDRLLKMINPAYVPNIPTPAARTFMGRIAANETAQAGVTAGARQFQKGRSTWQYRFIDPEGKARRFFDFQREWGGLSDEAIVKMLGKDADPKAIAAAQEVRDTVNTWEKMAKSGEQLPQPRPTDPFELNELSRDGMFRMLTGAARADFMETDFSTLMARRLFSHEQAVAAQNIRKIMYGAGINVNADTMQRILNEPGFTYRLPGMAKDPKRGTAVKFVQQPSTLGTQVGALKIGDSTYRQLDPKFRSATFPELFGFDAKDLLLPTVLADRVEDVMRVAKEADSTFFKSAEAVTSAFRRITLLHPSWIINNVLGNMWLGASGDTQGGRMTAESVVKHAGNVVKMLWNRHDGEKLANLTFDIRGQKVPATDLLNQLEHQRVVDDNFFLTSLYGQKAGGLYGLKDPKNLKGTWNEAMEQHLLSRGADKPDLMDQVKVTGNVIGDKLNRRLFGPWGRANALAENVSRTLVYLNYLEQGSDPAQAAASTMRTLFDYSSLTRTEQKLRTLVPFYSFLKNNTAYQMRALLDRPGSAAMFPKLKEAVEETFAGDAAVPDNQRPGWMRDALAIQYTRDPATRQFMLAASALPPQQLYQLGAALFGQEGIKDVFHYFVSQVNPGVQIPFSLGTGREVFSGRTIGANADMSVPEYLAKQIRPISEFGGFGTSPGPLSKALETSPTAFLSRLTLGGKVQDASDERLNRQLLRELNEQKAELQAKVRRAEGAGDAAASLRARADLLRLYQAYAAKGLESEVPKYALRQIQEVGS